MVYATILPSILKAKACTGKQPHPTRYDASMNMKALADKKYNGHVGDMKVYRCQFCNMFHFGHESKLMGHFEIQG